MTLEIRFRVKKSAHGVVHIQGYCPSPTRVRRYCFLVSNSSVVVWWWAVVVSGSQTTGFCLGASGRVSHVICPHLEGAKNPTPAGSGSHPVVAQGRRWMEKFHRSQGPIRPFSHASSRHWTRRCLQSPSAIQWLGTYHSKVVYGTSVSTYDIHATHRAPGTGRLFHPCGSRRFLWTIDADRQAVRTGRLS